MVPKYVGVIIGKIIVNLLVIVQNTEIKLTFKSAFQRLKF
jgi:hypothetical protein